MLPAEDTLGNQGEIGKRGVRMNMARMRLSDRKPFPSPGQ